MSLSPRGCCLPFLAVPYEERAIPDFALAARKLRAILNPQLQQHVCPSGEQTHLLLLSFQVIFLNLYSNFTNVFYCISWLGLSFLERKRIVNRMLLHVADTEMFDSGPSEELAPAVRRDELHSDGRVGVDCGPGTPRMHWLTATPALTSQAI